MSSAGTNELDSYRPGREDKVSRDGLTHYCFGLFVDGKKNTK